MAALVLFEDDHADRFEPLSWTRPVFDLRCGIERLGQTIERAYGARASALWVRPHLVDVVRQHSGHPVNEPIAEPIGGGASVLFVNGRVLADPDLADLVPSDSPPHAFWSADGDLVAAALPAGAVGADWRARAEELPRTTVDVALIERPWQLFTLSPRRIIEQAQRFALGGAVAPAGVHLLEPRSIHVAASAELQAGVVLDARGGPVVVDDHAVVMANSVIVGPAYVGPHSQVKVAARIYPGTTIGPWCKVGGEVEDTVFQGYANKQHDGFLGHSVIGEWCNLGAGTTTSDLKNNYSQVRTWHDGGWYDTGEQFVGLLMGDHSKTGINTALDTGTVVGVACNLFGGGLPPKHVPSFSWGGAGGLSTYELGPALETAARVQARRAVDFTAADAALLRHVFEATAPERDRP